MNPKRLICELTGHRWAKERREHQDVIVCRRCDLVTTLEQQRERNRYGPSGGGGFGGSGF
ncbi:MAG: DUF1660 family phage protein [Terracoccus sp.]